MNRAQSFSVRVWVFGVLVTGVLGSNHARASAIPLEQAVRLQAGASCLDEERLVGHIASWLGSREVDARLAISVEGSSKFARFVSFRIAEAGAPLAERRFEPGPASCEDLHAALGLAIALACRASLLEGFLAADGGGDSGAGGRWRLGVDALAGVAVLPGEVAGASLWLQLGLSRSWSARLSLSALSAFAPEFPSSPQLRAGAGFAAQLLNARLDACAAFASWGRSRAGVCLGFAAGGITVHGRNLRAAQTELTGYFALTNALDLQLGVGGGWSVHGALQLLVPVQRSAFVARDRSGTVLASVELSEVGAYAGLGLAHDL